jgi:hypothetical protein
MRRSDNMHEGGCRTDIAFKLCMLEMCLHAGTEYNPCVADGHSRRSCCLHVSRQESMQAR